MKKKDKKTDNLMIFMCFYFQEIEQVLRFLRQGLKVTLGSVSYCQCKGVTQSITLLIILRITFNLKY